MPRVAVVGARRRDHGRHGQFGADPGAWRGPAARIGFTPGLIPNTIPFTNRPTFQQVLEFQRNG